jgi:hypothetical protein
MPKTANYPADIFVSHRVKASVPVITVPITLEYVTRLNVPNSSIFWSGYVSGEFIHLYGRSTYRAYSLTHALVDKANLSVKSIDDPRIPGEDPRFFVLNGESFLVDNFLGRVTIIALISRRRIRVPLAGKNFVWYEQNGELRILWTIKPIQVFTINLTSGCPTKVLYPYDPGPRDNEYLGGTPLTSVNSTFQFGFGHRTYNKRGKLIHDPFLIMKNGDRFELSAIEKPPGALAICDPCCLLLIDNSFYLITAEAESSWFRPQDYRTMVYRVRSGG